MKRGKKYVISRLWGKCPAAVDRHAWRTRCTDSVK